MTQIEMMLWPPAAWSKQDLEVFQDKFNVELANKSLKSIFPLSPTEATLEIEDSIAQNILLCVEKKELDPEKLAFALARILLLFQSLRQVNVVTKNNQVRVVEFISTNIKRNVIQLKALGFDPKFFHDKIQTELADIDKSTMIGELANAFLFAFS